MMLLNWRTAVEAKLTLSAPPMRAKQCMMREPITVTADWLVTRTAPPAPGSPGAEQLAMSESSTASAEPPLTISAPPPATAEQPMMNELVTLAVAPSNRSIAPPLLPARQSSIVVPTSVRYAGLLPG